MYSLRRFAARALTLKPTTTSSINLTQARNFSRSIDRTPAFKSTSSFLLSSQKQQRRWLADEAPASTAETESPPKTEEEAKVAATEAPTTTESIETPNQVDPPSPFESFKDNAVETAGTVREKVSDAAATVSDSLSSVTGVESQDNSQNKSVYVGNLFFDVRNEDLERHFASVGDVVSARVVTDVRGLSKGFGYVEFQTPEQAAGAISRFHLQNFEGRRMNVAYAISRPTRYGSNRGGDRGAYDPNSKPLNEPTKTLFIGNMSFEMSDRDLNALFRSVKNVVDVRVAIDRRTGQPRGFAHADFIDLESAEKAMGELKGKVVLGRQLKVDYSTSTGRAALRESAPAAE